VTARSLWFVLAALGLIACKPKDVGAPIDSLSQTGTFVVIEPAPEHLRGRVALLAGARLYASPSFESSSWALDLPAPPLAARGDALPRARAMRVIGVSGDFVALTNDLADESELGCGQPLAGISHLRMLFYVPVAHLAQVITRPLELEPLGEAGLFRVSAGARISEPLEPGGMPSPGEASHWRAIDADGLRALVPVPDDAVGLAWDPAAQIELEPTGQLLFRDAEGSYAWLDDAGGEDVGLSMSNACAEHIQTVTKADEVASLRELAAAIVDEPGDADERESVGEVWREPEGPYRLLTGSDLRWTDGNLAAEVIAPFEIAALGQDWDERRCFALELGEELELIAAHPPVACVRADQLEFVGDQLTSFDRGLELEIGGTVRFGQPSVEGPWGPDVVRELLNGHHPTIAECLRPLAERLQAEDLPFAGRWRLELEVDDRGRVVEAKVDPIAVSDERVEDCLRAETGTWLLPPSAGKLIVALEFGSPEVLAKQLDEAYEPLDEAPEPPPKSNERDSGRVMIIRDEGEDELVDLPDSPKRPPDEPEEPEE